MKILAKIRVVEAALWVSRRPQGSWRPRRRRLGRLVSDFVGSGQPRPGCSCELNCLFATGVARLRTIEPAGRHSEVLNPAVAAFQEPASPLAEVQAPFLSLPQQADTPRSSTRPSPAPAPTPQAGPDASCSRDSGPRPPKTATAPPSTKDDGNHDHHPSAVELPSCSTLI